MKIVVRNFRTVSYAEIEGGPIVLLAGLNAAGKSSIITAAALALTGRAVPDDRTKKDAASLIKRGEDEGFVAMTDGDDGEHIRITWPSAQVSEDVGRMTASDVAAGLDTPVGRKHAEIAEALLKFIPAEPTREQFQTEFAAFTPPAPQKALDGVWSHIQDSGWDAAADAVQASGRRLKASWEALTQDNWGSRKGATWKPQGWADDLKDVTVDKLDAEIKSLEASLENAIAGAAVSEADMKRWREDVELATQSEKGLKAAKGAQDTALQHVTDAKKKFDEAPALNFEDEQSCPHCGGSLIVRGTMIMEFPNEQVKKADEIKARRLAHQKAEMAMKKAEGEFHRAKQTVDTLERNISAGKAAQKKLDVAGGRQEADKVDEFRSALEDRKATREIVVAATQAAKWHDAIMVNAQIQKVMAPDGLRRKVLGEALDAFNAKHLAPLTHVAGWGEIKITPELYFTYNGELYGDCSVSEQWRVRTVVQVAIAAVDGSAMVLVDGIDVLDKNQRVGVFKLLRFAKIPALVGGTMPRDVAPDLKRLKLGRTYWVDHHGAEVL